MTFSLNKWQWIKVWSKESRSPQYKHLPSTLIPNLKSSFLVTTILREILKCNSSSFTSLQIVLKKMKIGLQLPRSISNVLSHFFKPACFSVLVFPILPFSFNPEAWRFSRVCLRFKLNGFVWLRVTLDQCCSLALRLIRFCRLKV